MTLAGSLKLLANVLAEEKHFSATARLRDRARDSMHDVKAGRDLTLCRKLSTEQLIEELQRAENDLFARLDASPGTGPRHRQGDCHVASSGYRTSRHRAKRSMTGSHHPLSS